MNDDTDKLHSTQKAAYAQIAYSRGGDSDRGAWRTRLGRCKAVANGTESLALLVMRADITRKTGNCSGRSARGRSSESTSPWNRLHRFWSHQGAKRWAKKRPLPVASIRLPQRPARQGSCPLLRAIRSHQRRPPPALRSAAASRRPMPCSAGRQSWSWGNLRPASARQ